MLVWSHYCTVWPHCTLIGGGSCCWPETGSGLLGNSAGYRKREGEGRVEGGKGGR